jgi:hypothetical protein
MQAARLVRRWQASTWESALGGLGSASCIASGLRSCVPVVSRHGEQIVVEMDFFMFGKLLEASGVSARPGLHFFKK